MLKRDNLENNVRVLRGERQKQSTAWAPILNNTLSHEDDDDGDGDDDCVAVAAAAFQRPPVAIAPQVRNTGPA